MKRIISFLAFILPLVFLYQFVFGAVYYVDTTSAGTCDGTTTATTDSGDHHCAWPTIAKVNSATFSGDDQVLFNKGCTWREQLTVPSSGTSGHPITFGAYGSGEKPIINGSDIITSWASDSGTEDDGGKDTSPGTQFTGTVIYEPITVSAGTVASVSVYFAANASSITKYKVTIYTNSGGAPTGTQVTGADSGDISSITLGAWNTYTYPSPPSISAGSYWLAIQINANVTGMASNATGSTLYYKASAYGAWPSSAPTSFTDATWGFYATVTTSGVENAWRSTVTTEPNLVFFNGTLGTKVASIADCNADKKWYWASNKLYTYGTVNPNTTYPSQIEAPQRGYAISNSGAKSYITVTGLDFRKANHSGILAGWSNGVDVLGINISNCNSQQNYYHGIWANTGLPTSGYDIDGLTFAGNNCSYNGLSGIYVDSASPDEIRNVLITGNTAHHNCWRTDSLEWGGIKVWGEGASTTIVEHNTSYSNKPLTNINTGHGFVGVYSLANDTIFRYNTAYDNNNGIWSALNTGTYIYYNQFYNNVHYGIFLSNAPLHSNLVYNNVCSGNYTGIGVTSYTPTVGGVTNNLIKNNILTGNSGHQILATNGGENDGTNGSGNVYSYNELGVPISNNFVLWGASETNTLSAVNTLSGVSNNLGSDPLFLSTTNFHLLGSSPARRAGVAVGLTTDYSGRPVGSPPSIGAYEYGGGRHPIKINGHWR